MNTTKNRHRRSGSASSRRHTFSNSASRRGKFGSGRPRRHSSSSNVSRARGRGKRKMSIFDPSQFINANPVNTVEETYVPKNTFGTFGLNEKLVHAITSMGLKSPTPIQDQIIPEILKDRDVIGLAETGTGKTAAFLIPLIENTLKKTGQQTLILAPTRELALQIDTELRQLSRGLRFSSVVCVGGINIRPQIRALKNNNHFVIGTPGRVLDLINRKHFTPANITTVVLDEADRMLDMGFINDMKKILSKAPKTRGTLLFCATISKGTEQLMQDFLRNPIRISVKKRDITNSIEQNVISYGRDNKFETLTALLSNPEFKRVIVFGAMKHDVKKLAERLITHNVRAESIHGNKNHTQRQSALAKFKSGNARVLVATDVAARGIHVESVTHVINYDLPNTFEDYVHRIGRTGRAEKRGKALTFVSKV